MSELKSRHDFFTVSGIVSRALITASKISPEPADLVVAAAFGVVEILGAKRLWKVFWPAVKHQFKEQLHALSHRQKIAKPEGTVDAPRSAAKPTV